MHPQPLVDSVCTLGGQGRSRQHHDSLHTKLLAVQGRVCVWPQIAPPRARVGCMSHPHWPSQQRAVCQHAGPETFHKSACYTCSDALTSHEPIPCGCYAADHLMPVQAYCVPTQDRWQWVLMYLYDPGKVPQVEGVVGLGGGWQQLSHRLAVHVQSCRDDARAQLLAACREATSLQVPAQYGLEDGHQRLIGHLTYTRSHKHNPHKQVLYILKYTTRCNASGSIIMLPVSFVS